MTSFEGLNGRFSTILVDPPWRCPNRTVKTAVEESRSHHDKTMGIEDIAALPVAEHARDRAHLYLWCPNGLLVEALDVMKHWGFKYETNIVWHMVRKDGGTDSRGVGFYFRNATELLLFGTRGQKRAQPPGRKPANVIVQRKDGRSRKPRQTYELIQQCSPGPYLELFARERVDGWTQWGNQNDSYEVARPHTPVVHSSRKSPEQHERFLLH